jgi:hypothetical protein
VAEQAVDEKLRVERIRRRAYELWEQEGRPKGREREHWQEAERQIETEAASPSTSSESDDTKNEGEGSRSAARDYNRRTQRFIENGKVEPSAREAKRAFESAEGSQLREAENVGKKRSRGEDPEISQPTPPPPRRKR